MNQIKSKLKVAWQNIRETPDILPGRGTAARTVTLQPRDIVTMAESFYSDSDSTRGQQNETASPVAQTTGTGAVICWKLLEHLARA